ncbi:hypothetical protein Sjap_016539 [Stephania japonica]|uniref:Uncharacterized protein n=1 Tax=Stephania japonica TaxID=461633 RepID=A0AAP0NRY2_9MAGN
MEAEEELVFDRAVDAASKILGNLDAFVHCYDYEDIPECSKGKGPLLGDFLEDLS